MIGDAAGRARSDPVELRSARGDPTALAPALTNAELALMNIGTAEMSTSIVPFAPIRTRRFLAPSSSDPEQPRRASDVAQIEAIAANRERLLIEQGEAVISGIGVMMNTEMTAAHQQINQLRERERATALASGLQNRRLELEAAAHVQRDHAQAEAVVQGIEANAQANVSELHSLAILHAEQQAFQYQHEMQKVEQRLQLECQKRYDLEAESLKRLLEGTLATERASIAAERALLQSTFAQEGARLNQKFELTASMRQEEYQQKERSWVQALSSAQSSVSSSHVAHTEAVQLRAELDRISKSFESAQESMKETDRSLRKQLAELKLQNEQLNI